MKWKTGEWVEVRSPLEISKTLDERGMLDGLPFMPEMAEFCGKRLKVLRRAQKTCVELPGGSYQLREFINNDVVILEAPRCAGSSHDGCQRACQLFWKVAWLKPAEGPESAAPDPWELASLRARLETRSADHYICQSSQLSRATLARQLGRVEILAKCWRDVRSGAVGVREMAMLILLPFYRKVRDLVVGRPRLTGQLRTTPVGDLNLQPGELVEILGLDEMRQTLDTGGRNRGLVCDIELKKFCGKRYRVRTRLDRMISETTGQMRSVQGTVILDGNTCMCARAVGGCPRQEYCYWREVWLRRVEPQAGASLRRAG